MAKVLKSLSAEKNRLVLSLLEPWLKWIERREAKEINLINQAVPVMRQNMEEDQLLKLAYQCAEFRDLHLSFDQQGALFTELEKLKIPNKDRFEIVLGLAYFWRRQAMSQDPTTATDKNIR
jgi:hypothetical protein